MFFQYNEALAPPYQVLVDTNFINFSIKNKLDIVRAMMDCMLAKCAWVACGRARPQRPHRGPRRRPRPPAPHARARLGIPCITDCVMAELEKLGPRFRIALRLAKDPRFRRLTCTHTGTYADDCLCNRVQEVSAPLAGHPPAAAGLTLSRPAPPLPRRSLSAPMLHRRHVRSRPQAAHSQGASEARGSMGRHGAHAAVAHAPRSRACPSCSSRSASTPSSACPKRSVRASMDDRPAPLSPAHTHHRPPRQPSERRLGGQGTTSRYAPPPMWCSLVSLDSASLWRCSARALCVVSVVAWQLCSRHATRCLGRWSGLIGFGSSTGTRRC